MAQVGERLIRTLSAKGLRVTEQRRTLVRLFAETSSYLSPKEVYFRLVSTHPGLSYDTVYRNLRLLQDLGVLERYHFDDGVKFRIGCFEDRHHHHHLICLSCSRIVPIDFCPMKHLNVPGEFQIVDHHFDVYGYCGQCRSQEDRGAESMEGLNHSGFERKKPSGKEERLCC
ncbi:Fur family transcriptional regulator [Paenibacillus beijingensis]|uniref:Fur family transcriptional regulator n=1 Tax=Paenibacillus beijingensis TaxID=1126833 RepID=A0A0D5NMM6_9BACL|nr:Fur family transcriptional regulator [Paenibacillus beijingensis]AJY76237.1 hypothetical protein VN24_18815 [Paenibacillus beijingensis]